ncbi:MAG: hypothetical protein AAF368_08125, partial [Planctomycetota bacterium]
FGFRATFVNGEETNLEQWVGRGAAEVTFIVGPDLLPDLAERTITKAVFYGTASVKDGDKAKWKSDPIEDIAGAVGVVDVPVEVSLPAPVDPAAGANGEAEPVRMARVILDVRYDDFAPFEGGLAVRWASKSDPRKNDREALENPGSGRFAMDLPAGELSLVVSDRYASGSLPPWRNDVDCAADQDTTVYVTLPRGASATITRPEDWGGEWFLRATWKEEGDEDWQGGLGYGTDEESLTLSVMRAAEWRFELRRENALEADPLIRTVVLGEGESVVVDE